MKRNITLLSIFSVFVLFSCVESSGPTLPKEEAFVPFNALMTKSKTVVQEVLIAAYQNPELNEFAIQSVDTRSNCPSEIDLDPNIFPKTLIYTFEEDCLSDGGTQMSGSIEVLITDRIGRTGMEIRLFPRAGFKVDGHFLSFNNEVNPEFKAIFIGEENALENYNLVIRGLVAENEDMERYEVIEMDNGLISFEDVDQNNESEINSGPTKYLDDLAVLQFASMEFLNNENETLTASTQNDIKFDLFCDCPLSGKVDIYKENRFEGSQIVDYSTNATCRGEILVDIETVECK